VPCAARIDDLLPNSDFWRWTPGGLRRLIERCCERAVVEIEAGGNLVAALAALLGLAVEDLRDEDLVDDDPVYPMIACASATKPNR
jgi:hypothetical protein